MKDLGKNATDEEKYSKQFITIDSIKKKFDRVFGIKNDFLAEMLFLYMTDHKPLNHVVNFFQFFTRLYVFWPSKKYKKKGEKKAAKELRKREEDQEIKAKMRNFMYDFVRLNGGEYLNILDLVKMCCYFPKHSCAFGEECDNLMSQYKLVNIEPKYVHQRQEFSLQQYMKFVPYSCLIDDLRMAFCGQVKKKMKKLEHPGSDDGNHSSECMDAFRLKSWKMTAIFDESVQDRAYFEQLEEREGKTAAKLWRDKKVTNEKDLRRGYDIVGTWNIQQYLNFDSQ